MAKKKIDKIYAIVKEDKFYGYFETIDLAEEYLCGEEMTEAYILEVTKISESNYPEEPEMEFWDRDLGKILSENL